MKWGKSKFDDIEVDTSEPALLFKTQLFALTGVPVERMKVIVKGGPLKDDASMADLGLKQASARSSARLSWAGPCGAGRRGGVVRLGAEALRGCACYWMVG